MSDNIKTTVIIPNYNGKKYLQDCLTFLKRSAGTTFHTMVVDDASTDESCRMVREQFPKVELVELSENGGFARAVNEGIKRAKTEFVLLLNNDTIPEPEFVAQLEKEIQKSKRYFSVSAKMLSMKEPEIIDDCGDLYCLLGWALGIGKGQSSERYTRPREVFAACGGAAIYKRSVLQKLGLFDELHFAYLEDIDVGYRAQLYGYRNRYCPKAIVYHAGSASSGSRYNAFKVDLSSRNNVYLILKNMPPLQLLLNLPFLLAGFLIKTLFFIKKGFGGTYIKGLWKGIRLGLSEEGRKKRIRFSARRLPYYIYVQYRLIANTLALWDKIG